MSENKQVAITAVIYLDLIDGLPDKQIEELRFNAYYELLGDVEAFITQKINGKSKHYEHTPEVLDLQYRYIKNDLITI
jgi:hypothetical protein